MRRSASPRTSSNPTPSPFVRNGCLRPTMKDCAQTIGPRIPTSRFGGESENNSGSSHRDQPIGSCQSTPPPTTPSTFNAIFCPAASSRCFVPRRSLSGIKVGLPPDPDHDRILATVPVSVSMPCRPGPCRARRSTARSSIDGASTTGRSRATSSRSRTPTGSMSAPTSRDSSDLRRQDRATCSLRPRSDAHPWPAQGRDYGLDRLTWL